MSLPEYYLLIAIFLIGFILLAYGLVVKYSRLAVWTGVAIICCSSIVAIL